MESSALFPEVIMPPVDINAYEKPVLSTYFEGRNVTLDKRWQGVAVCFVGLLYLGLTTAIVFAYERSLTAAVSTVLPFAGVMLTITLLFWKIFSNFEKI